MFSAENNLKYLTPPPLKNKTLTDVTKTICNLWY